MGDTASYVPVKLKIRNTGSTPGETEQELKVGATTGGVLRYWVGKSEELMKACKEDISNSLHNEIKALGQKINSTIVKEAKDTVKKAKDNVDDQKDLQELTEQASDKCIAQAETASFSNADAFECVLANKRILLGRLGAWTNLNS